MDIQKEKEAFINVYVNYKDDSRKIQFNEETEQFMWRKNNVSDTEVEYVHLMNQRWYAWLACAKSKAQAVPEGFVLVEKTKIKTWYQDDDEPENFCNSESDWDCLGDCIDNDEIMQVNKIQQATISTTPMFGVWKLMCLDQHGDAAKSFVLTNTREEAEQVLTQNKVVLGTQEPANEL